MLAALLERYARGETDAAEQLLDEIEPTLYGYARSLCPGADEDPAPALDHAQALTLAFHLLAEQGRIEAATKNDLRGWSHKWVLARLADPSPLAVTGLADEATGSARLGCISLGWTLEDQLTPQERLAFAERLRGNELGNELGAAWSAAHKKLQALGVVS